MRIASSVAALLALTGAAWAAGADDAAALLRGTVGEWSGTLTYKDYQSGEKTALPVQRSVTLLPDGKTMQAIATYDDGASGTVYINTVAILNAEKGTWESASFRDGDGMETGSAELSLPKPAADATHWTIETRETGTDGDSPSIIRETITRDGERLTTLTEYDRLDDKDENFAFRNEEVLTLKAAQP